MLWVGNFEDEAIRPHVLGQFRDLLLATAQHPAMLYLSRQPGRAPRPAAPAPNGREVSGINENYARELMELHTLGVDGGYSQDDVDALARILTGWGFDYRSSASPRSHRPSCSTRRGTTRREEFSRPAIAPGGEERGDRGDRHAGEEPGDGAPYRLRTGAVFRRRPPPPALVDRLAARIRDHATATSGR